MSKLNSTRTFNVFVSFMLAWSVSRMAQWLHKLSARVETKIGFNIERKMQISFDFYEILRMYIVFAKSFEYFHFHENHLTLSLPAIKSAKIIQIFSNLANFLLVSYISFRENKMVLLFQMLLTSFFYFVKNFQEHFLFLAKFFQSFFRDFFVLSVFFLKQFLQKCEKEHFRLHSTVCQISHRLTCF